MDLAKSIEYFAEVFSRSDKNFGSVEVRPGKSVAATRVTLSEPLRHYFSLISLTGKVMIGGHFQLYLFPIDELETAQAEWRWVTDMAGNISEDPKWPSYWVVIADHNGDAIFCDGQSGRVYGSIQKVNMLVAPDLASFFQMLASGIEIEMDKYNFDVEDEDFNLIDDFLSDVRSSALGNLGADAAEGFMRFFFG